jgi:hypothetical protein
MKKKIIILLLSTVTLGLHAQNWLTAGNTTTAALKLGTNTGSNFPINFYTNGFQRMVLTSGANATTGGYLGIGTITPSQLLTVKSGNIFADEGSFISSKTTNSILGTFKAGFNTFGGSTDVAAIGTSTNHKLSFYVNNTERMIFDNSIPQISAGTTANKITFSVNGGININPDAGNYGYGVKIMPTNSLTKAIAVTGTTSDIFIVWGNGVVNTKKIYAEELSVRSDALGISWPDYIFNTNHKLMSLDSLEKYLEKYKHLPEVPCQNEIIRNGFNVGELSSTLLKKIEELTLYIIKQDKRIKELENNKIK